MTAHQRPCPFCEATCGVVIEEAAGIIHSIKGDPKDSFSKGYICPKAIALRDLHTDPDRLKRPLIRHGYDWREVEWVEAFDFVGERINAFRKQYGANSLAVYQGNPTAHNLGLITHGQLFFRTLGTDNLFSVTSADQLPQMLASEKLYGHALSIPVPDIDRTHFILILGANPLVSNGSLMTAPDMGRRLKSLRQRGGTVVVVDPRTTETAMIADRYFAIVPGTDVFLLSAMVQTLFAEGLLNLGRLQHLCTGLAELEQAVQPFSPERVENIVDIPAGDIKTLTRDFASSPAAVCYGRVGVSTQRFGGTCLWLINVLNILTGNLDRAGGSMFPTPAVSGTLFSLPPFGEKKSRVRGAPNFVGEFPVSILAEEILTPGNGQIRALITSAGNPVLSCPNGPKLERALAQLEFMVSIDFYLNETTRHAHVILPPTAPLERDHYDLAFGLLAVRNRAVYAPALFPRKPWQRHDWEIIQALFDRLSKRSSSALLRFALQRSPRQILDWGLKIGAYGFRRGVASLSVRKLLKHPAGLDLGALQPRLPKVLLTPNKKIPLACKMYIEDFQRAEALLIAQPNRSSSKDLPLLLIGRRNLQCYNSWLHNAASLIKGPNRCTLLMHNTDAAERNLSDGEQVAIRSHAGCVTVPIKLSGEIKRGVVSLPHGWGHHRTGIKLRLAQSQPGASSNDLSDDETLDDLSGNAVFNGIPVQVEKL